MLKADRVSSPCPCMAEHALALDTVQHETKSVAALGIGKRQEATGRAREAFGAGQVGFLALAGRDVVKVKMAGLTAAVAAVADGGGHVGLSV